MIVTYQPDARFPERVARIADQVDFVAIVDNDSNSDAVAVLDRLASQRNIQLIANNENLGVAVALNQGVHCAKKRGYQWVLLFDQDTVPENSMVQTLASVYDDFEPKRKVAVIGSNFYDTHTQRVAFRPKSDQVRLWVQGKTIITSGSLLSVRVFGAVGPFREEFFIDEVDHEYCLRARSSGFINILAIKPTMRHAIGAKTVHSLLWKSPGTSNHSPLRRYYMIRNSTVLAREYLFKEPRWVFAKAYGLIMSNGLMLLFEDDRLSKLRHGLLGFWHGLVGKLGKQ